MRDHFIAPGNVYRKPDGTIVVVSYCSLTAVDVYHPGEPSYDVLSPDYLRISCQFIGQNYRLK